MIRLSQFWTRLTYRIFPQLDVASNISPVSSQTNDYTELKQATSRPVRYIVLGVFSRPGSPKTIKLQGPPYMHDMSQSILDPPQVSDIPSA